MQLNATVYETAMQVRPDDIDMFRHVHSSRYIDYVLAARYDQMARCYGMPMDEFLKSGLGWVVSRCIINYKRALVMADHFIVRTNLEEMQKSGCLVKFSIIHAGTKKLICDGEFHYTMINLESGRAEAVAQWIIDRYSI
jgi:YbgC/YbaW family acyl-CoA thioester hydrolase